MSQLKDVISDLAKVEGVIAVLVVGRDGFVVEGMTSEEAIDLEAVGAIVASSMAAADSMGREMSRGAMRSMLLEYDDGPIAVGPAGPDAMMVGAQMFQTETTSAAAGVAIARVAHTRTAAVPAWGGVPMLLFD